MKDVIIPDGGFSSFNDFFTRRRHQDIDGLSRACLISPCDAFLSRFTIDDKSTFSIKHSVYTVKSLLNNDRLAESFSGGTALIFRLTPSHYHRYCYSASGAIKAYRRIPGILHCVRPAALDTYPVFSQNSREYQVIKTKDIGTVVQMEIGALNVGKIVNHREPLKKKNAIIGDEKGYFSFGGSTIVVLTQKPDAAKDISPTADTEIPVSLGTRII